MNHDEYEHQYGVVSTELMNPFNRLGQFSLSRIEDFFKASKGYVNEIFSKIDVSHKNGLFFKSSLVEQKIDKKEVSYVDIRVIQVYVPPYLKPKASMVTCALELEADLDLCVRATRNVLNELSAVVGGYIGDPSRLTDPNLIIIPTEEGLSIQRIRNDLNERKKINQKHMTSTGSSSFRPISEAYSRLADLRHVNQVAAKIDKHYVELIRNLDGFMTLNKEVAEDISHLNAIMKKPEYDTNSIAAKYVSDLLYQVATIIEFIGATLYNAQVFLKSVSDTNRILETALQ